MQDFTKAIIEGDQEVFKSLFEDYYPILCLFASRIVKDDEVSKDIAHEALLLYWEKRMNFDNTFKVKSFLYTVARNKSLNYLRHNSKTNIINDQLEDMNALADYTIIEQETLLMVRKCINDLPPQMQRIMKLHLSGMTNREIADFLGISEDTVKATKRVVYIKLRPQLEHQFYMLSILSVYSCAFINSFFGISSEC